MRIKKDDQWGGEAPCRLTEAIDRLAQCLNEGLILTTFGEDGCGRVMGKEFLLEAEIAARIARDAAAKSRHRLARLEELVHDDELTGLMNRRAFDETTQRVLAEARRYDERGVLLYIDPDGLTPVKETYGAAARDKALKQIARLLKDAIRETDYAARLEDDTFAILLVRTERKDGLRRAEALDRLLNGAMFSWQGKMIGLRADVGIHFYDSATTRDELVYEANDAMCRIKQVRGDSEAARVALI